MTSLPVSESDEHVDSWLGVPMFFGGIRQELARATIEQAQLDIEQWTVTPEVESDGRTVEFTWIVARKL